MSDTGDIPTLPAPNRAVIVHGYRATPADHWFEWLAAEFRTAGLRTAIPALPDPESPDSAAWAATVAAAIDTPDPATVVVAHSLGCLAVLRALAARAGSWRLGHLVLVSGFVEPLPALPELDAFIADGCPVGGLRSSIERVSVIRSDDDPIVPAGHTDRLAARFGVRPAVVRGAGHFLASEGVTTLAAARDAVLVPVLG